MLVIDFSYNFLYVWNCMKLYDKKFLIYGNCMIRSFGQPAISWRGGQCGEGVNREGKRWFGVTVQPSIH